LAFPAVNDTELLTVSQVAEALSASGQTIRNWIRGEQLRAARIGNRFLIPRTEVERMRGDSSVARGESPWDTTSDTIAPPLPRAIDVGSPDNLAERLLGG
jgi:excisionase family DNA binding protein